ncbi:MAG: DUF6159 family protein [Salinisphaeraceae bacterium]
MMGKVSRALRLMRSSWWILNQDRELLVFPLLSGISMALVLATFMVPGVMVGMEPLARALERDTFLLYELLAVFYFANYLVIIFFNAALMACVMARMDGHDPTVGYGLRCAWRRLPQIAGWAFVSSTVGVILRMLIERVPLLGQVVIGLLGMAWTVTAYLVVPVLVAEGKGPVDAYRASVSLLRRSWGEQLVGEAGLSVIFGVLTVIPTAFIMLAISSKSVALMAGTLPVCGLIVAGLIVCHAAMQSIYAVAIYRYGVTGRAPAGFDDDTLRQAFRPG